MADPSSYRPAPGTIPTQPGVYRFSDEHGQVIYVGKARSLRQRLSSYFQDVAGLHPRTARMVRTGASVEWTVVGTEVEANGVVGEVESTKSVSDLFCPVPGSVTETNEEIVDSPELVNSDPFGAAWLFKVKVTEIPDDLLDKAAYDELTKEA